MDYNKFSNYFGLFANKKFPSPIQNFINWIYTKAYKIDLDEFEIPLNGYKSLNELFTRTLKVNRELEEDFISPCDGRILSQGIAKRYKAFSVKNRFYDVNEFLNHSLKDDEIKGEFQFLNLYLSPQDYHHFHSPCDLEILSLEYIKGDLFSVAPKWLKKVDNLYIKNERVILKAKLPNQKIIWLVFVGALNVGKIKIDLEPKISTNAQNGDAFYKYENLSLKKGEHLGNFELGSTIVIITQPQTLEFSKNENDKTKFGEQLAKFV